MRVLGRGVRSRSAWHALSIAHRGGKHRRVSARRAGGPRDTRSHVVAVVVPSAELAGLYARVSGLGATGIDPFLVSGIRQRRDIYDSRVRDWTLHFNLTAAADEQDRKANQHDTHHLQSIERSPS